MKTDIQTKQIVLSIYSSKASVKIKIEDKRLDTKRFTTTPDTPSS
jgi:hypothetical protein